MYIKWIGHSCFKIIAKTESIIVDPYAPNSVPGYKDIKETANKVFCSHEHHDHNYVSAVSLNEGNEEIAVTKINCYHDSVNGNERGKNIIHIFEYNNKRVAHLGDLGHMLSDSDIYKLKGVDCLLIPIGGYYTIDEKVAYELVQRIQPKIVVPMHYRQDKYGYEVLDTVDNFLKHFNEEQIICLDCNTLYLGQGYNGKVVVLNHQ